MVPKHVLITGGAKGIGRETAKAFAKEGYRVTVHYHHSQTQAHALREEIGCSLEKADISDFAEVRAMAERILARGAVDVLVNNAGVALSKLFIDTEEEEFDRVMRINVKGIFNITQPILKDMMSRRKGCVVNVSSMWGKVGASMESVYSASKAAVIGLTKALAKEVGLSGVRVNAVCPGAVETDMLRQYTREERKEIAALSALNRIGSPTEIARVILFLASDGANFITGQALSADGQIL